MTAGEKIKQIVNSITNELVAKENFAGRYEHDTGVVPASAAYLAVEQSAKQVLEAIIHWKKNQLAFLIKESGKNLSLEQSRDNSLLYDAAQLDLMLLESVSNWLQQNHEG